MAKDKTWLSMSMKRFVFFYQVAATFLYFQSKQNGVEFYRVLYRSGTLYGNITCIFIISYSFYNYVKYIMCPHTQGTYRFAGFR